MIIRNMELLVQSLKHEVEGPAMEISSEDGAIVTPFTEDYDEVY